MIDVTGCQFVVTEIGKQSFVDIADYDSGVEYGPVRVARGVPDMKVSWVGGEPPHDLFRVRPLTEIGRLATDNKFLAVPVPQTTVEQLAAAVLMKEPAGQHLVDCLMEQGVIDINHEIEAKLKADTLAKVVAVCEKVTADSLDVLRHMPRDWIEQARVSTARRIRDLISELA